MSYAPDPPTPEEWLAVARMFGTFVFLALVAGPFWGPVWFITLMVGAWCVAAARE